eukprot:symbB.v1.2.028874.t1/scaffold3100.1/size63577/5
MRKVAALTLIATSVGYTTVDKYPATLPEDYSTTFNFGQGLPPTEKLAMAKDFESAKACLNHAKHYEALGDHHQAMVLFGRGECLAGREGTRRKCGQGVTRSLQHLEEQLSGKYEWAENFKADPDALLGSPKLLVHLPLTAYSEPVSCIMGKHGRGLAAKRDTAIGDLLFVDKAWLVGNYEELLEAAMTSVEDANDLQTHRLLELYDGTNAEQPLVENLLPGRVARDVETPVVDIDEDRMTRTIGGGGGNESNEKVDLLW